ncbi:death domain-associated protein 6-like [Asparagus officinalis]|uniref:death domain-associated protein 6-like n=1 Tax=Asparagus officinalis TaxID=4686 RepID=UPI00098E1806|nr:death domain-associated protein 6-like [Asparagus officinalis]
MAADAESAPVMDLPKSPALEPGGLEENPSPPPSALMSQASDLIPSPTMGLTNKPAAGTNLPEPSATRDDEEQVDYEGSSIGDATDEDRGDEDAEIGNAPGDGEGDDGHDSMDDITTFDDAPKAPSDKASGYTPFYLTGSPPPGTTTAPPSSEQQVAQVPAPLQEQHLPGSPVATASTTALPEANIVTSPLEQQVVQVSAPAQE